MTETNQALAEALNDLPDPFIAFDCSDAVIAFNRAARAELGDLAGSTILDVTHRWGAIARSDDATGLAGAYANPGGSPQRVFGRSAAFTVWCQPTGTGKALLFRRCGLTDLAPTLEDEMLLEQGRANFINLMSHSLRTPLHSILGFSEIISLQALGPDAQDRYREYARDIASETVRLHESLDALLTLAFLESEDGLIRPQVYDAGDLLRSAIASFKNGNDAAAIDFTPPVHRIQGRGDSELVHQALTAILSECLRANRTPALTAAVKARSGSVVFSFQGPTAMTAPAQQTADPQLNTGLWIAHTIASAHGGGLRLTKPNHGVQEIRLIFP